MTKHFKKIYPSTLAGKQLFIFLFAVITGLSAHAQPVVNFTSNITSGCAPLVVNFTDQSTGSPTTWKWDLGNGVISTIQNPSTTYFTPGLYTVKLVAVSSSGKDSLVKTNYINILSPPQIAFSTTTSTVGCFPLRVQFTDNSTTTTGSITAWEWDFGDGTTSTQQNPYKIYTTAGNYNVVLKVTNSNGCFTQLLKPSFIRVAAGVTASFNASQPINCKPPELINFTNLSTGPGTLTYSWKFGDGGTSAQQSPSYTYVSAGLYNVQLIVQSNQGCTDTIIKNNSLSIGTFQSAFTVADKICLGDTAKFQNTSLPDPPNSTWYFGDGTTSLNKNPNKIYSAAGFYTVKLVNNYGACLDSASKTIEIINTPVPAFTANQTSSCKFPFAVNFQDNTPGAAQWLWNFGDGTTSTQQNPSHTYNAYGQYNVSLTVTTAIGCKGTTVRNNFIQVVKPVITVTGLPNGGCIPFTINPVATVTTVDNVSSWLWNFGDGATSTLQNPSHTYNATGNYTVKLFITTSGGCTDSLIFVNGVRTGTKTTTNFSANPLSVCAGSPVQFTDLSTGNPDEWLWDFGDGKTSTLQNPLYTYTDTAGVFTISLTTFNNKCADSSKKINYITVLPPAARFNVVYNCNSGTQVSFTDNSIGALTWLWDFGDGSTSTQQNPVHLYAGLGTYTVKLTVTNGGCTNSITKTIKLLNETVNYTADKTAKCKNDPFVFTATGVNPGNITAYAWSFGDGTTGNTSIVNHAFSNAGNYTVKLVVTDLNGCRDSIDKLIRVNGPNASFNFAPNPQCTNQNVNFNNNSITDGVNSITSSFWDFGDGIIGFSNNNVVPHLYTQSGSFIPKLRVTDAFGCSDSITAAAPVNILQLKVDFRTADTVSCPGAAVQFNNLSIGSNLSYAWDFGDGNTSAQKNPTHSYVAVGKYTVKLVALESIGCIDSVIKTTYITIDTPIAKFDASDTFTICPPLQVQFTNRSTFYKSVLWDFGDGNQSTIDNPKYSYSIPKVYTVTLFVTSAGGCVDSVKKTITVISNTKGVLTYNPLAGCYPQQINFKVSTDNPVKYYWDFGDGTTLFTADSIQKFSYTYPGFYVPKVTLQDAQGCLTPVFGIDTIKIYGAKADFGFDKVLLCDNGIVNFRDSTVTSDIIRQTLWNFGDGVSTSNIKNPSHNYTNTGLYSVSLTIRTVNGCSNTITKNNLIKVVSSPQINISGINTYCSPAVASLNGNLLNPDTSVIKWKWDINNTIINQQNTGPINLPNAGVYPVILSAANSSGCVDTARATVTVNQTPTIDAGNDTTICLGNNFTLQPTGGATYVWSPATYLSCTNCTNPVSTPTNNINYYVTGTSAQACSAKDSIIVRVKKPFTITARGDADICVGTSVKLSAIGAENYIWSPATGLSNPGISNPIASPTVNTTYQVTGYDSSSCFADTAYVQINVFQYPTVNAGKDTTIMGGSSVQLTSIGSNDIVSWFWSASPPGNINCTSCPATIVKPVTNTTYTIEVKNGIGCTTTDDVKVIVLCADGKIYLPNTFTPNNDGRNDWFYVIGNGVQTIKSFLIFDRWGKVIFERKNVPANSRTDGWNGMAGGYDLPTGVYPYVLEVICGDGALFKLNGSVTLIR